jgi:riboflavin kinase/FMN adenylyltransferase
VHILDFDESIYGCDLVVEFVERLREERRYADVEELKAQIERDVEEARRILAEENE